ncbi:glucose-1-phosphate cytidylyltransferase [Acetobacterium wieringae]|uniref:glucose-1-phosphate cytidylyltransferase n=1 Tax=Acetobacterium wieringae TaxID=52694 RepID=UPI0020343488|nr:glucose-1-phosphate cytidylyltransferase [Acetobacterium wieringae]URN85407.1 glucose-1-phosphate cytidylyltransferase [Acetobacterium wieringae]
MKVVILAGGLGTRISEESHLKPKPMIEIGGAPILWHIMKYYSYFGYNDFVICCGYKGYIIKQYFADYYLHRSDVTFDFSKNNCMTVHNNVAEPWRVTVVDTGLETQTGGRIKRIQKYTGNETFLMTYGDGVSNIDLNALVSKHHASGKVVTLSAIQPGGRYGVLTIGDNDDSVIGFREKAREDGGWVNAGFMVMEPEIFDYIDHDNTVLEREPLEKLSLDGKLGVYKHHDFWQCMDTTRDKVLLENLWEKNKALWKIWNN